MSQIHKVILLNKPLKIFEFTPLQLVIMFVAVVTAFVVGGNIPGSWKLPNGLPLGFVVGLLIVCGAIVFVKMSEVKPWPWWRNMLLYRIKALPTVFMPHLEDGQLYPDPTIIEAKKRTDDYYVDAD